MAEVFRIYSDLAFPIAGRKEQPALNPLPNKHIGQHIYDWVNNCDLTQLDAIMLAFFVLSVGCGTIGSLFLMGYLQNAISAGKGPPMVMQTVVTDRGPVQYRGFVVAPHPPLAPHMEPTAVAAIQAGFRPPLPWSPADSPLPWSAGGSPLPWSAGGSPAAAGAISNRFGSPRSDEPFVAGGARAAQSF
ncbi:MAG TPA: hypothetical protein V6D22_00100 [Candidatus Obscuribacterales bacterium]